MKNTNTSFILNVDKDFSPDPDKSVLENLFEQYERSIFSSIITAFGLDLFIKEQVGGDVDTIYNVRKDIYKNDKNKKAYDERGDYKYIHANKNGDGLNKNKDDDYHGRNEKYRNTIRDAKGNIIEDAYTGREIYYTNNHNVPSSIKANCEHVIAANKIHNDRGRLLAGLPGPELANSPENLALINASLNKSLRDTEIPDYIANHPELSADTKKRMMARYNQARKAYETKLARAYYLDPHNPNCRRFYFDTGKAAVKRGWQMGVRQVIGFIFTEVWFCIKDELKIAGHKIDEKITAIISGIKKGFESAKEKFSEIIAKFGEGTVSGIISSLTTTLCNIFFTTSKNIGKMIRQAWSSIVEASKIIIFNPDNLWFCDRMTAAAKILASGACVIVGTGIQEIVRAKLSGFNPEIADITAIFAGSLCSGLLTVTLMFYIDNNPFDKYLSKMFDKAICNYKEQARLFNEYCAKLQQLDIVKFENDTETARILAEQLSNINDDNELNSVLKNAAKSLGIESPWGSETLDEFMGNPKQNKKLIFKA